MTTYTSTGSITQEWIATQFPGEDRYSVRVGTSSSANPLVLCLGANGNCELRYTSNTTVENYKVKFIAEPNEVYGIALVNRPNWVCLLYTSGRRYLRDGVSVQQQRLFYACLPPVYGESCENSFAKVKRNPVKLEMPDRK